LSKAFFITTMGCQMNDYDSDILAHSLIHAGYCKADAPEDADVILINTCTVRAKPEQKAYTLIGRMSALKERRPHVLLAVVGCLAQQKGNQLMKRFPQVDLVMGPREIGGFKDILKRIQNTRQRVEATKLEGSLDYPLPPQGYYRGRVTGYVSIMEGCNNFCTYCIVPYVRGREVSRPPREIIQEAEHLVSEGVREITLLGQNVNSYVWKGTKAWNFCALLRELNALRGLMRLRFTTSHPKDLSRELIECFGELDKLCPHIHLPFQAGSNTVLRGMGRGYTRQEYLELVQALRRVRPDIAITSDVMVGFPGERDKDFEMTLDLIKQVQFDSLFSFKYSDRKGTVAEKRRDKVEETEKASRLTRLQTLEKEIMLTKNQALEGRHVQVLVEGKSKRGHQLAGRTGTNKIVNFQSDSRTLGDIIKVNIKHAGAHSLTGEPCGP